MARLILVADDSPTIQRRAQGILRGGGFEVETVSNGVAAIKKLRQLQPILVLADVSMPGKDGYEVCEFVKTSPAYGHVPVVLVASDLEPYDEQRGARAGADGTIKKPFAPHDLIAMVAKFASLGEAPASQPTLPDTLVTSAPARLPEVPPRVSGPEPPARHRGQDLAPLQAGVPSVGPPPDQMAATPVELLPDTSLQPSPGAVLAGWPEPFLPEPRLAAPPEDVVGGPAEPSPATAEPFPGFASRPTPEPAPEPSLEAAPVSALFGPESTSKPVVEAAPGPALVTAGAAAEAAPELALVGPELVSKPVVEAAPEPALVTAGAAAEAAPELASVTAPEAMPGEKSAGTAAVAESALPVTSELVTETTHLPVEAVPEAPSFVPVEELPPPTEPVLGERPVEPIPPLIPSPELLTPEAERTVAFREAAETVEPVLVDELAPPPPAPEPSPVVEGAHWKAMPATHLDSFSLAEAAEGEVYVAPPESGARPAPEAETTQPGVAPASAHSVLYPEWVRLVVHKVVMRMAPPVLPPEFVEKLVRTLTQEIISELSDEPLIAGPRDSGS